MNKVVGAFYRLKQLTVIQNQSIATQTLTKTNKLVVMMSQTFLVARRMDQHQMKMPEVLMLRLDLKIQRVWTGMKWRDRHLLERKHKRLKL